jgi:PleD family two-component response regulator
MNKINRLQGLSFEMPQYFSFFQKKMVPENVLMHDSHLEKEWKVLVVDTETNTIEDILICLNGFLQNWRLSVVYSGKGCMDIIKADGDPDLIILGLNLSDTNGFELLKQIRNDSDVPIVIISSDADIHKLEQAFDNGANDYVLTLFNTRIFAARLKALIRRREWDMQAGGSKLRKAREAV